MNPTTNRGSGLSGRKGTGHALFAWFTKRIAPIALVALGLIAMAGVAAAEEPRDGFGVVDTTTGVWYLYEASMSETTSFYFGNPGDYPFMGDWNCDGVDTPGLYRQSDGYVYLRDTNTQGSADISFFFGNPGDVPVAGDFNADGCDTVSIYRPSNQRFYIINELGTSDGGLGAADYEFGFGDSGDKPFVGDFNGNGEDTIGLHRESTGLVYFRNTNSTGNADSQFIYGDPADRIIAGEWAIGPGGGVDTVGIFRPSEGWFYLRYSNTRGNADFDTAYGNSDMLPVAGDFGPLPGGDDPPPEEPYVPPPPPPPPLITGPVYAIGDSVMRGVACNPAIPPCYSPAYNLENQIPDLESNASVSRPFSAAAGLISTRLSRSPVPQVIVVHLGTNGGPTDSTFAAMMAAARDVPRVLVMTVKQSNTANESATNAVIRRNVPLYDNAELVDWYALAKANPSWLAVDKNYGAHLWTDAARRGYVDLVADSIRTG